MQTPSFFFLISGFWKLIQINFEDNSQSTVEFNVDDSGNTLTVTENDE